MSEVEMGNEETDLSLASSKSSDGRIDVDLEDGPLFRATVKEYEGRTLVLKGYLKRILKAASSNLEAKTQVLEQDKLFIEALKEAPFAEPLFSHYLDFTWEKLHEQQERLLFCMQSLLIHPLQKLYDMDIKTVDTKRRRFEDVSKDYYANLAKYLSIKTPTNNKKQQRTELEFIAKKREFDLVRFDYYTFLRDLHGGKKEQEILYHLLNLYEKQYSFFHDVHKTLEPHKQGLDELAYMIAEASREQKIVNQERNEKRKILIQKYNTPEDEDKRKSYSPLSPTVSFSPPSQDFLMLDESLLDPPPPPPPPTAAPPIVGLGILENKFKGIRDLEQQDENYKNTSGRRKEGFLFATSKPTKNHHNHNTPSFDMSSTVNWHKYWCVLSGGQLHEYSNWKRHLETHIEPINLRFATVREARNADRRFCFEIITPNFRRMYQATSSAELSSWIATINNAISSLLNGMSSSVNLKENVSPTPSSSLSPNSAHWKHGARSLSGALSGLAAAKDKYLSKKRHHGGRKHIQYISSPTSATPQIPTTNNPNSDLLIQLRKDLSNTICADCSAKNPDWCSLNLGILICIECSGIHRSLGTHISKVRSLTLDSASFTPDIVQLLLSIGNAKSNEVWESDIQPQHKKPIPTDSRDQKLKYIQSKYVDKLFVSKNETLNPMDILYNAIERDDIPQALYAIAIGANVNQPFTANKPIIPILSTQQQRHSVLQLPMLDIAGNEYLDRTMEINLENPILVTEKDYIVRYALHFALLNRDEDVLVMETGDIPQRPTNPIAAQSDSFNDDSCSATSSSSCSDTSSSSCSDQNQQQQQPVTRVFPMAEFLFQNGADVYIKDVATGRLLAHLVGLGQLVDNEAIHYLNMKNSLRGQSPIVRTHVIPPPFIN
ncbi:uncharacterized protein EV154DRAFT_500470 [Mucor mucedo]|uniref:uncharacterized protein n=1 Tax=Mucor mucedo TaxID=29922 RepID=UPI00221F4F73|nr:uncharacterized protein EV154DRAFT_500470 [Mucor mucedo]KAI7893934.1 hypothetical protein EV154DRAFT_500470 [Mucor mucedo]